MRLREIFHKPVDRPIEGVIKADDESSLRTEVDEYVLTNEVAKRLSDFLEAYTGVATTNGVWLSGFFGSGKSHLLKMISLLLENRTVEGEEVLGLFEPKCGDDAMMKAAMQRAARIPSQSVLFNIDQKANIISTSEDDAVLKVFVNVFDQLRGFYGKEGYIAKLEKDLDKKGYFERFKEVFEEKAGEPWESGRELADLYADDIARAFEAATGNSEGSGSGVLERYHDNYAVSIGDFAEEVRAYIETKEEGFRLNFFVDEVGQYIADKVKLMTNLQTLAESLFTKCEGRSWIVVTAQEDMDSVIGDMSRRSAEDFSKIQARFALRLKLTSTNVEEVIQKRLLVKTVEGERRLEKLYHEQSNNFKTLFDFADGSKTYRNFRHEDDFVQSYPFVPYQYPLFQSAIQGLSKHNAFEGRHTAVGERSMLGVFQEVAKSIADQEIGELATFDKMFEGIRNTIRAQVHQSILTAEGHLGDAFATQVLKALFLVKYVDGFNATIRNLTVLMLDDFDTPVKELRERVEAALGKLEAETYIQRNGEVYEYLTDQEKDVEREIKDVEVDVSKMAEELGRIIFDQFAPGKIGHAQTGQPFVFTRKLDDRSLGREQELAIHIASPFNENADDETVLMSQHMGRDELLIIMPSNQRLVRDLKLYLQTDSYVRMNSMSTENDTVRKIVADKGIQNQNRKAAIRQQVEDLLRESTYVAKSDVVGSVTGDPKNRIAIAFQELLTRVYPNLNMLRGQRFTEEGVVRYLDPESELYPDGLDSMSLPETEVLGYLVREIQRVTLHQLVQHFGRKPYGWEEFATLSMVAKLIAKGKAELRRGMQPVDDREIKSSLQQARSYSEIVVAPLEEVSAASLRQLKDFYKEMFDEHPAAQDPKAIAKDVAERLKSLHTGLSQYADQHHHYPALSDLRERLQPLHDQVGKNWDYYTRDFLKSVDDLLDLREDVIAPLEDFMNGPARGVYDRAARFVREESSNLMLVDSGAVDRVGSLLRDSGSIFGGLTKQIAEVVEQIDAAVKRKREEVQSASREQLEGLWQSLEANPQFASLSDEQKASLKASFDTVRENIDTERVIAAIEQSVRRFREERYPSILQQIDHWNQPTGGGGKADPPPVVWISRSRLNVNYGKGVVETAEDAADYAEAVKKAMEQEIASGKKITL